MSPRAANLVAKGFARSRNGELAIRRIVVSFDAETFDRIAQMALADGCSFAEAVRTLVEWGFDCE